MAEDVAKNRHLYFYQGGEPHPLRGGGRQARARRLHRKFRAIDDYFGYTARGFCFRRGSERARRPAALGLPRRRPAGHDSAETRGQNSWVNFGRHNYDAAGNYKNIPAAKRPYAQQKVALLPEEFWFMIRRQKRSLKAEPTTRKPAKLREEDEQAYRRPPKPSKPKPA